MENVEEKETVKPVQEFISEAINDYLLSKRKRWPCHVNRVSAIGHPCMRYLVYLRLNWQDQELPSVGLLKIFRDGNLHEDGVKQLLKDAGIQIIRGQEPFFLEEYKLSGHIDGAVEYAEKTYPAEIKGLGRNWFSINSIDDMFEHKKYYIRSYPIQLMSYLKLMNVDEGLFILKGKTNSDLKIMPCQLNVYLMEEILEKAKKINEYVDKKEYPERIYYDPTICDECGFRTLCLPEKKFKDSATLVENLYLLGLLQQRDELKDAADTYKEVDGDIKKILNSQANKSILIGDYMISGKEINKKEYLVKASSYIRWEIKKLIGGLNGKAKGN